MADSKTTNGHEEHSPRREDTGRGETGVPPSEQSVSNRAPEWDDEAGDDDDDDGGDEDGWDE